jgi:hypothetical protein
MLFDLTITDELRERLNNQDELLVEYNRKFGFVRYDEYLEKIHIENSITSIFIELLFQQHPFFENIKNDLIVTTSKSSIMSHNGLNGEGNWHKDNILFPTEKENNLIISWNGNGTSCLTKGESDNITLLANDFIKKQRTDYHNYPTPYTYPIHPLTSYYSTDSNEMKILSMNGKQIFHRRNPLDETDINTIRYVLNIYY